MGSHAIDAQNVGTSQPPAPSGFWSWIVTTDHKRIGILYGVSAFAFFLVGGLRGPASPASARRAG